MPVSSARWPGIYDSAAFAIATRREKGRSPAGFRPERRDVIKAFRLSCRTSRGKNLFALATGVVSMSARSATTPAELATAIRERLSALARAQDLTLPALSADETKAEHTTTLAALLHTILAPFGDADRERIFVRGRDVPMGGRVLTNFALLLHEFATNAAKYGSLSVADGRLDILPKRAAIWC
jgi:two-component sensor histidine kinase